MYHFIDLFKSYFKSKSQSLPLSSTCIILLEGGATYICTPPIYYLFIYIILYVPKYALSTVFPPYYCCKAGLKKISQCVRSCCINVLDA